MALEGELDLATVPVLEARLSVLEQDGVAAILLDLRDLAFMDCIGVRAVSTAWARAAENGHRFAVVGANEQARRVSLLVGEDRMLRPVEGMRLLDRFNEELTPRPVRSRDGDGTDDD